MREVLFRVRADLAAQASDRYPRLSFDLVEGDESFDVRLEVPDVPGLTVDLGCEGPDAWCGWSGGARRSFVVTRDDATPGYVPGVRAGRWAVVLGLHTVPAAGAEVTVRVRVPAVEAVDHGPDAAPVVRRVRSSNRDLPAPPGLRWYAGDTHAHSLHSDGALSLSELANEGVASGLDFLCVTDHNTVSHHRLLDKVARRHGITLVAGQEVTTHRGHANAFGRIGFIDFRCPAQEWARAVAERGGLLSVNHPTSGDCAWLHPGSAPAGVEIVHGSWYGDPIDRAPLAWLAERSPDAVLLGGGDFHDRDTPLRPGAPTTWVAAESADEDAILAALIAGRTTMTTGATWTADGVRPDLLGTPVLIREGDRLLALTAGGLVLVDRDGLRRLVTGAEAPFEAPLTRGPYWLEDADRRVLALCR